MNNFQYEWWHVKAKCFDGMCTLEVKSKNKENAIKKFQKDFPDVVEFYWETLTLDRKGYQRKF